jgi:hypothetical protein
VLEGSGTRPAPAPVDGRNRSQDADSGDSRPKGDPRADESSSSRSVWRLLASTPLFLFVTYDVAFLAHEYGHSFAAWILGIKSSPWPISWGGNSIGNMLFLSDMDENVDYDTAMASGGNLAVAVVAVSGIGVNAALYLLLRFAAPWWRTSTRQLVAYTALWFLFMQVGNLETCTTGPGEHISRGGGFT